MILPDAGDRDGVKAGVIEAFFKEPVSQFPDAGIVAEAPVAGQKLEPVGVFTMLHQIVPLDGGRDIVGTVGHGVLMENLQIFKMSWHDHSRILLICYHYHFITATGISRYCFSQISKSA